jgi:hypothetical protein
MYIHIHTSHKRMVTNTRLRFVHAGMPDYNDETASARAPYVRMKMHDSVQEAGAFRVSGKKRLSTGRWNETVFMYTSRKRGASGKLMVELREPRVSSFSFAEDTLIGSARLPLNFDLLPEGRQRHSMKLYLRGKVDRDADSASIVTVDVGAQPPLLDAAEETDRETQTQARNKSRTYTIARNGEELEAETNDQKGGTPSMGPGNVIIGSNNNTVPQAINNDALVFDANTQASMLNTNSTAITETANRNRFSSMSLQTTTMYARSSSPSPWYTDPARVRWNLPEQLPGLNIAVKNYGDDTSNKVMLRPDGVMSMDSDDEPDVFELTGMQRMAELTKKEVRI